MDNREEWLSVKEVAATLGTTTRTVYLYIRTGRLPAHKLGASYCVRKGADVFTAIENRCAEVSNATDQCVNTFEHI